MSRNLRGPGWNRSEVETITLIDPLDRHAHLKRDESTYQTCDDSASNKLPHGVRYSLYCRTNAHDQDAQGNARSSTQCVSPDEGEQSTSKASNLIDG